MQVSVDRNLISESTLRISPKLTHLAGLFSLLASGCQHHVEHHLEEVHKVVATSPEVRDVTVTQQYVCQIRSQKHIEIRALEEGYLEAIPVKEGQRVKQGDLLFQVLPTLYQAKLDAEMAEAQLAQLELDYSKQLVADNVVAKTDMMLNQAKLAKAQAKAQIAQAELNFASIKAPFDGILDRLHEQQGSLVNEGEILTTLSDNSIMWVYFNMPEKGYLEYMTKLAERRDELKIELVLANHSKFPHLGTIGAIEADFNNETGNIAFRADFSNPDRLLRHGQTGNVLISRVLKNALVIPQRAKFEILDKIYVFVLDKDDVVHQREITVQYELDDIYVIQDGLAADDRIVLEGVRQIRDGEKVEYESKTSGEVMAELKHKAE
jgi:membrane fusion protein (multidrug efflux system)